jgi:hypothetical protein
MSQQSRIAIAVVGIDARADGHENRLSTTARRGCSGNSAAPAVARHRLPVRIWQKKRACLPRTTGHPFDMCQ